jgi:hypothetical protein
MSEPRRYVHRKEPATRVFGSGSYITAGLAVGSIAFGGTATGGTPTTDGGTASGAIVFAPTTITEISALFSAQGSVTFGGTATGRGFIARTTQAAPVVFAGTATAANVAANTIRFAGTATAASGFFTSEVAAAMVFAGTAEGVHRNLASGSLVFAGTVARPDVSGGTVEGYALPAEITFAGTAVPTLQAFATTGSGAVAFGGSATATRGNTVTIDAESLRIVMRAKVSRMEIRAET